jgi:SAM-dependent methyltransferase
MKNPDPTIHFFPEIGAGGFSRVDSTIQFYERVNALIKPDFVLLDFGAGRGAGHLEDEVRYRRELCNFKGKVREVIGADVDPIVTKNPLLNRALVLDPTGSIPLPDECVHLIISDFTFEHIRDPSRTASELNRILIPGGWICVRTPNKYGYVALANQLVPESLRLHLLRFLQPSREEQDVFRTFYRLNTVGALKRHFKPAKYDYFVYSWDAEPAYHANYKSLFRLLKTIHDLTPPMLRTLLLIFLRKRAKHSLEPTEALEARHRDISRSAQDV